MASEPKVTLARVAVSPEELRERARRVLAVAGADTQPPPRHEATDTTGSVRVSVDGRGRVEDVDISRTWRNRLTRESLADAVLQAYRAATQQAVEAFGLAALAADEAGEPPPAAADRPSLQPRPPTDHAEWSAWARDRLETAQAQRRLAAQIRPAGEAESHERVGRHGLLIATLQGSDIVRVAADTRQVWHADTEQLREDARDVLSTPGRA